MAPDIPKKHRAAMFKEKGGPLVIEEVETKMPGPGQVLLKVLAAGCCHSDTYVQGEELGIKLPLIPGHEVVGDVVAVGPNEKVWKIGDRVGGGWHGGHDGTCKFCRRGLYQCCVAETVNGISKNGGYAEYVLLNTEAVVPIPADADPAAFAPLLCAGVTTFNAIRHMGIPPGEIVAIQGLGGLGHLALQFASKMGYRVVALSSSASKEKFARDLGATDYIDGSKQSQSEALKKMGGAALIVSTAPNPDVLNELLGGLEPLGKILMLSPVSGAKVDTGPMVQFGLSIHSWPSGHALDSEEVVNFAKLQGINCMIEKFSFDQAYEAYEHMRKGKARFRSVIVM